VDLSTAYDFSAPGFYEIAYQSPLISHVVKHPSAFATTLEDLGPVQIMSEPVEVEIIAENEQHCQAIVDPPTGVPEEETHPSQPHFILTGVVEEISLSARFIKLEKEVKGISMIVLTADTVMTTTSGKPFELDQIHQGLIIEVLGMPGESKALIAHTIQVFPPEEKTE
jgi:hypothetical protein